MNREAERRPQEWIPDDEIFERMTLSERIQHGILAVCFTLLVLTGLPVFLHQLPLLDWVFSVEGSFRLRGLVHRAAALGLIGVSVYHVFWVTFTRRGRWTLLELIPRRKDAADAVRYLLYNLGFKVEPPQYGRYNFIEKFEYWAVVWGNAVMISTGFFLWYPVVSTDLFPMWVHEIFRVVHGFEALLALLAITIWHMYNVHLNPEVFPMSRVWLSGKISGRELRLLHPLEYEEIRKQRERENSFDS